LVFKKSYDILIFVINIPNYTTETSHLILGVKTSQVKDTDTAIRYSICKRKKFIRICPFICWVSVQKIFADFFKTSEYLWISVYL